MLEFARTAQCIAETASKNEKTATLAAYLRSLGDADLVPVTRYFTGNPFAQSDERSLSVGTRTIVAAATAVWGIAPGALRATYGEAGDLGAALGSLLRAPLDLGLFRETLGPASLMLVLDAIADARGKTAARTRALLCERIFGACTDPLEATYIIKIMTGDLRVGLKAGLVIDAIALAFERDPEALRRAASAAGDLGAVALAARHDTLADVAINYHAPLAFMLATPIAFGSSFADLNEGAWSYEDKFDGVRIQAHVTAERISLFSRTLNDTADAYPEIVAALRGVRAACILDGEIVAERDGRVLPFRYLQPRLQRKDASPELQAQIPVRYVVFDALAQGDRSLLDEPLTERRMVLAGVLADAGERVSLAASTSLTTGARIASIDAAFEAARERGHEGLVFKRRDASYVSGRRGKRWLKLKRELATLDVVVTGVEWGHGRRAKVLSDYTFSVRAADGTLAPIGKAYSGLTDLEIAEMTTWFLAHQIRSHGRALVVEPEIVIEVAFDIIQPSTLHASGYALRFPRIVRLRPDKRPVDIDTLERVTELYDAMLAREGVAP